MLNPVSSAHISFSSPPASFQTACAAGRSEFGRHGPTTQARVAGEEGRGLGAGPLSPGYRPHLVQWLPPPPTRGAQVGTGAVGSGDRGVQVPSEKQLFPAIPEVLAGSRCSKRREKHFSEKVLHVPFTEQTAQEYKHHLRSAWGPQAPGAGGLVVGGSPRGMGGNPGVSPFSQAPPGDGGLD